jgi:hypothetical protein
MHLSNHTSRVQLPQAEDVKYLGLRFDWRFAWRRHKGNNLKLFVVWMQIKTLDNDDPQLDVLTEVKHMISINSK